MQINLGHPFCLSVTPTREEAAAEITVIEEQWINRIQLFRQRDGEILFVAHTIGMKW